MRARRLLITALMMLAPFAPALVAAVEYGGLGGVPANPDPDNPRTQSIFVHTIPPGESKQDAVKVVNNTPDTKVIEVYATDSEVASGGSFACRQKVDQAVAVGSWIRLSEEEIELAPGTNKVVPFDITVPKDVDVGEHNGCIVIQEKNGPTEQVGNGVQLSFRSALRVAVTIPGEISKDLEFKELAVDKQPKKYVFSAKLHNKGNVSLDTEVKVYVKNLSNKTIYENGGVYPLLAQQQPVELNFDFLRPFWGGVYRVSGTAAYNGDAKAVLGSTDGRNVIKHAPGRLLFIPPQPLAITAIALALVLVFAVAWLVSRKLRKRRSHTKGVVWKLYTVRQGDTLAHLARRLHTDWKVIAKKNKLRPPYDLEAGSTIKLPIRPKSK